MTDKTRGNNSSYDCAGFTEIDQDDQIRLIKQGAFEVNMARFSLLVDHDKQTMIDPSHNLKVKR